MSDTLRKSRLSIPLSWRRRAAQLAMLAVLGQWSFYGIFRCPFAVPFVSCNSCPVLTCWGRITSLFWGFWLLLPLSVVFFGRAFCGWLCPGGLVNQMLGTMSAGPLSKPGSNRFASWGLSAGLATALFLWLGLGNPRWMTPIRIGEPWNSLGLSFEHASAFWLTRTFMVLGLTLAGLFVANLWCRWACPTGGLLERLKGLARFRVFKTSACNGCNLCKKLCHMATRPDEVNCTSCGDCLTCCPTDAIEFGRKPK